MPILVKCRARHTILYRFNIAVSIGNSSTLLHKANILVKCRACHTILCRVHIAANIFYYWFSVAHNTCFYVGSILLPTLIFFSLIKRNILSHWYHALYFSLGTCFFHWNCHSIFLFMYLKSENSVLSYIWFQCSYTYMPSSFKHKF
jgi:hypothetical protein